MYFFSHFVYSNRYKVSDMKMFVNIAYFGRNLLEKYF